MYKTKVYCLKDEFEIETGEKISCYTYEGMIYLQDSNNKEIFAINKDELIAIDLNTKVEEDEEVRIDRVFYGDGEALNKTNGL